MRPGIFRNLKILRTQERAIRDLKSFQNQDEKEIASLLDEANQEESPPPLIIMAPYQPEATTYPESKSLHNVLDLVIGLRNLGYPLPIIFKEHPVSYKFRLDDRMSTVGVERSTSFYASLRMLGCLFVGNEFNQKFSPNCDFLTFNGSVGLERSLRGLRTFVVTEPWYGFLPGIYNWTKIMERDSFSMTHDPLLSIVMLRDRLSGRMFPLASQQFTKDGNRAIFEMYFRIAVEDARSSLKL